MPWIGKCVIAVVVVLTLSRRAGTGALSQVIIPYHSLEYSWTEGGKDQEREREGEGGEDVADEEKRNCSVVLHSGEVWLALFTVRKQG